MAFLDVIQYDGNDIVWEVSTEDYVNGSKLRVKQNQVAIVVDGSDVKMYKSGEYTLINKNKHGVRKIVNAFTSSNPFHSKVFFFNTKLLYKCGWGGSVNYSNTTYSNNFRLGGVLHFSGIFEIRIRSPKAIFENIVGSVGSLFIDDVEDFLRDRVTEDILAVFSKYLNQSGVDYRTFQQYFPDMANEIKSKIQPVISEYGFDVTLVKIDPPKMPDIKENKNVVDAESVTGTQVGYEILGDSLAAQRGYKVAKSAASNPGNPAATLGMGLATGGIIGNTVQGQMQAYGGQILGDHGETYPAGMAQSVDKAKTIYNEVKIESSTSNKDATKYDMTVQKCPGCGKNISSVAFFCKYCGFDIKINDMWVECPKCGEKNTSDSLYCEYCGQKL